MSDVEEEAHVLARQRAVLAHDLGDLVEVPLPEVAQRANVVDVLADDLHNSRVRPEKRRCFMSERD